MFRKKGRKTERENNETTAIQGSEGFLVVDEKKCQGCLTCMLMCSLVHEGVESLPMSRIQVLHDPFAKWPDDLSIEQCRQCRDAPCAAACPVDALQADVEHGGVKTVDTDKCNGCGQCAEACCVSPCMLMESEKINSEGKDKTKKVKCDLCINTPFWKEKGGITGKHACIEICPVGAIAFVPNLPGSCDGSESKVNLRDGAWGRLGYPED
jgi:protein NrfC